jgi:hypothetical protein
LPVIDVSKVFSDIQDRHYAGWSRYRLRETMKTIWEQYNMKKTQIVGSVEIPEPGLRNN